MNETQQADEPESLPWWRVGTMWLVVGGPASVVVAATLSGWIALRNIDPVIGPLAPVVVNETNASLAPAVKARNHAATPQRP